MVKYEFRTKSLDEFEFVYQKNNEEKIIPFKRTVEIAVKLQNIDASARFKMYEYMTSIGKTKKDLIVETKNSDGTITVDDSNYREFESQFLLQESYTVANEIYKMLFGMDLVEIVKELNLNQDEAFLFSSKVREILVNEKTGDNFPSGVQTK